jgi:hypothetical protein
MILLVKTVAEELMNHLLHWCCQSTVGVLVVCVGSVPGRPLVRDPIRTLLEYSYELGV